MSGATPCGITYQSSYCLAFSYDDIVKIVAVAHVFRESFDREEKMVQTCAVRIPPHKARGLKTRCSLSG